MSDAGSAGTVYGDRVSDNIEAAVSAATPGEQRLRIGRFHVDVTSWVYCTVTLMSVLAVYDGWEERKRYLGVVVIVVAPTVALALAHLFATVLDFHVHRNRPPTGPEWRVLIAHANQNLWVAGPPLVVLVITGWIPTVDLPGSIRAMMWFLTLSLGFWGWFAGRRAGLVGWRLLVAAVAGLLVGLVVIGIQIAFKPH